MVSGSKPTAGAETAIVVSPGERPVDLLIALWLDEKFNRSRSERTRRAYADTIAAFRSYVRSAGHDLLDTDLLKPPLEKASLGSQEDLLRMAGMAGLVQEFVDSPKRDGTPVALSTCNQWLAILSSFYAFAEKRGTLVGVSNPIKQVARSRVQSYARATPLKAEAVQEVLAGIDRRQPMGLRDYALLAIGFSTGRRLAELAALRWGDVLEEQNGSVKVTLTFPHAKGGKVMRDTLPHAVGQVLLEYKQARITDQVMLRPEDPVWVSYSSNRTSTARALHPHSIGKICRRYLATSKVHTLRHSFARGMEDAGAKVSEIQQRLGHSNIATTSLYLGAMRSDENAHGDVLAESFGVRPLTASQ
jgi:site-specific recombinase XerD